MARKKKVVETQKKEPDFIDMLCEELGCAPSVLRCDVYDVTGDERQAFYMMNCRVERCLENKRLFIHGESKTRYGYWREINIYVPNDILSYRKSESIDGILSVYYYECTADVKRNEEDFQDTRLRYFIIFHGKFL